MSGTRSGFIRLTHAPPDGIPLAHAYGCAGEHMLDELWPVDKAPLETQLAELLHVMRDARYDVETRIAVAEAALRIKDALSVTVEIVKYADAKTTPNPRIDESVADLPSEGN